MSRYREMTPGTVTKLIAQGYGQGARQHYKPWFRANGIPSRGRLARTMGVTTGRVMHLVSELEASIQLLADFDPSIKDQNEQYLLDPTLTLTIARKLGIRHPREKYTGHLLPMTTDLLLTQEIDGSTREIAVSVKYESELNGPKAKRVWQKIAIERMFHTIKGRAFVIATDRSVPPRQMSNLRWLRESHREGASILDDGERRGFEDAFHAQRSRTRTIGQRIAHAARAAGIEPDAGLDAFRLGVWGREIAADLSQWLRLSSPFVPSEHPNLGVELPWAA